MRLNSNLQYIDIIKQQIASNRQQSWELLQQIYTPNTRHIVSKVRIPGIEKEFIIKKYTIPHKFKLSRKIELLWHMYFDCYACRAYDMAIALSAANLPTFTPVASWQTGHGLMRHSYLLMEKLPANKTLKEYLLKHLKHTDSSKLPEDLKYILEKAGYLIRCLHENGFWHSDLTLNNFLILESPIPELYIMDLESIKPNKHAKVIKNENDLIKTCLKRIELKHNCLPPILIGYRGFQ